jgi:hypothetical protein
MWLATDFRHQRKWKMAQVPSAPERRGNSFKGFNDFNLKVKAEIWP